MKDTATPLTIHPLIFESGFAVTLLLSGLAYGPAAIADKDDAHFQPGNLLVTPEGHTKVSDLGLAGWLNEEDPAFLSGKIVGTADYLPPEQVLNPGSVAPVGDIYSLGCTLYYAVTGKVPYPGGTTAEKAHRHCNDTLFVGCRPAIAEKQVKRGEWTKLDELVLH